MTYFCRIFMAAEIKNKDRRTIQLSGLVYETLRLSFICSISFFASPYL